MSWGIYLQRHVISIVIVLTSLFASPQHRSIGWIEQTESWVYMYDMNGNRYQTLPSSSVGVVLGYSSSFFVSRKDSWVYLYDSKGDRYKTLPYSQVGDVVGVGSEGFTSRNGSWVYIWSRYGNRIDIKPYRRD